MATFNKFNDFVEQLLKGKHDFSSHTIKVYLSNATPSATDDAVMADLAEISAGNGYTAGGNAVTVTVTEASGTASVNVTVDPALITAAGGSIGPFRYAIAYNASQTTPLKPLIGWWDYGSSITLAASESFSMNLAATLLTIS